MPSSPITVWRWSARRSRAHRRGRPGRGFGPEGLVESVCIGRGARDNTRTLRRGATRPATPDGHILGGGTHRQTALCATTPRLAAAFNGRGMGHGGGRRVIVVLLLADAGGRAARHRGLPPHWPRWWPGCREAFWPSGSPPSSRGGGWPWRAALPAAPDQPLAAGRERCRRSRVLRHSVPGPPDRGCPVRGNPSPPIRGSRCPVSAGPTRPRTKAVAHREAFRRCDAHRAGHSRRGPQPPPLDRGHVAGRRDFAFTLVPDLRAYLRQESTPLALQLGPLQHHRVAGLRGDGLVR